MHMDVERLRRDHTLFRRKLEALETASARLPETRFVVRELCVALAKQLPHHAEREARAYHLAYASNGKGQAPEALATVHEDECRRLEVVISRFLIDQSASPGALREAVTSAGRALLEHMDAQEAELFPWLEAHEPAKEPADHWVPALPAELLETMTVNRMVAEHPETRSVFECLFVNLAYEGYDSLDEVAYRRGMEASELLSRLEQAMSRSEQREAWCVQAN